MKIAYLPFFKVFPLITTSSLKVTIEFWFAPVLQSFPKGTKSPKTTLPFALGREYWGTPENWDANKVALSTMVDATALGNHVETFTIGVNNLTNDSATLDISWEKTMVSIKFEVPTKKAAMASIEKVLAGPTGNDYFSAAQYFYQADGDLKKALEYVNKAVSSVKEGQDVPFWHLRLKSLIQAKLGDKAGAIATAKLSLAGAEKEKNDDYVKMNNDSIKEWSKK